MREGSTQNMLRTKHIIEQKLNCTIQKVQSVAGGCINDARIIDTTKGRFFIKENSAIRFPQMFEMEAKGLEILRQANIIRVPKVVGFEEVGSNSVLILECIESQQPQANFWKIFGQQLAQLHQKTAPFFGLSQPNYIGSLPQNNKFHETWTDFFIQERLEPQLRLGTINGYIDKSIQQQFDNLYKKLSSICPNEKPSLIHGDLWNGNFMTDENGNPVLIDPAVAFAHREMDLAMTKLFGGFSERFYVAYEEVFPLEKGFNERFEIYNLYYLLVHLNLFGRSYLGSIKLILKRFL